MRALIVDGDRLTLGEVPTPTAGPGEVRIRVAATALNRADLLQRKGHYPPPPGASPLLGLEVSGSIDQVGAHVTGWKEGDPVCALLAGGGYAEHVVVDAGSVMAIPAGLTLETAAAVPEAFLTAFQAIHALGALPVGGRLLIHAGASGVGTAAIQLARLHDATVWVTASASKHAACRALGAHHAIDYRMEPFAERIRADTDGAGVDMIVDVVGAPYLAANVDALAMDGRLVLLGTMGGHRVADFSLLRVLAKRVSLLASTLRNRSVAYKAHLVTAFRAHIGTAFDMGRLRPVIDRVYPWTEAEDAHARMAANKNVGKLVLLLDR
ncbi:MAG: NAD(P)H-quinone oxidoreductase [Bacteroidota bacterium]